MMMLYKTILYKKYIQNEKEKEKNYEKKGETSDVSICTHSIQYSAKRYITLLH